MRPLIAANWKMHGLQSWRDHLHPLVEYLQDDVMSGPDAVLFPPAVLIADLARDLKEARLMIGGQTCHEEEEGAYTGEISAAMLLDAGACFVLAGHSERRQFYGETNDRVSAKMRAALTTGLRPVLCVGESLEQRKSGQAWPFVRAQLDACLPQGKHSFDIAYEPVWSIGTGEIPAPEDIESMHGHIREYIQSTYGATHQEIRLLYGGSVKPENAEPILSLQNVHGALVGGASLDMLSFISILKACPSEV